MMQIIFILFFPTFLIILSLKFDFSIWFLALYMSKYATRRECEEGGKKKKKEKDALLVCHLI